MYHIETAAAALPCPSSSTSKKVKTISGRSVGRLMCVCPSERGRVKVGQEAGSGWMKFLPCLDLGWGVKKGEVRGFGGNRNFLLSGKTTAVSSSCS